MAFELVKTDAPLTTLETALKPRRAARKPKVVSNIVIAERPGYGPFNLAKGARVERILTSFDEALPFFIREAGWLGIDFETSGLSPWHHIVTVVGLYGPQTQTACVLHINGFWEPALVEWLNQGHKFVTHNGGTFDILFLVNAGINVHASTWFDSLIGEQTVTGTMQSSSEDSDESEDSGIQFAGGRARVPANLQAAVKRRLKVNIGKDVDYRSWVTDELTEQQIRYVAEDISFLPDLRQAQIDRATEIDTKYQKNAFYGTGVSDALALEMRLLPTTVKMESRGLPIDEAALMAYYDTQTEIAASVKGRLDELFGEINWESWQQVKRAFLTAYGAELPTTREAYLKDLSELAAGSPIGEGAGLVVKYRHAMKRAGMYNAGFLEQYTVNGWLRGRFKQCGTDTGRYASSEPNMQQIPKDKGNGDGARHIIGNHPDFDIVAIDYSQIEVRIAANEAEDLDLIELLETDDIHRMIASKVFGIPPEEVTKDQRQLSKAMSFCLIFGGGAETLVAYAKLYGADLPLSRATPIITDFFDQFQGLKNFKRRAIRIAGRRVPFTLQLPTGLRRTLIPGVNLKPTLILNNIVQGTAAAGLKYALLLAQETAFLNGTLDDWIGAVVHDEIVSAVPKAHSAEFAESLKDCMIRGMVKVCERAPVRAEISIGSTWG